MIKKINWNTRNIKKLISKIGNVIYISEDKYNLPTVKGQPGECLAVSADGKSLEWKY